jgi:hypothetical protein
MGVTVDVDTPPNPAVLADRQWPVDDRRAAFRRLCERGLMTSPGRISLAGMDLHLAMERETDFASAGRDGESDALADNLADLLAEPVATLRAIFGLGQIADRVGHEK